MVYKTYNTMIIITIATNRCDSSVPVYLIEWLIALLVQFPGKSLGKNEESKHYHSIVINASYQQKSTRAYDSLQPSNMLPLFVISFEKFVLVPYFVGKNSITISSLVKIFTVSLLFILYS